MPFQVLASHTTAMFGEWMVGGVTGGGEVMVWKGNRWLLQASLEGRLTANGQGRGDWEGGQFLWGGKGVCGCWLKTPTQGYRET